MGVEWKLLSEKERGHGDLGRRDLERAAPLITGRLETTGDTGGTTSGPRATLGEPVARLGFAFYGKHAQSGFHRQGELRPLLCVFYIIIIIINRALLSRTLTIVRQIVECRLLQRMDRTSQNVTGIGHQFCKVILQLFILFSFSLELHLLRTVFIVS